MLKLKISLAVFVVVAFVSHHFAEAHNGGRHQPPRRRHSTPHPTHHGRTPCHRSGTSPPHPTGTSPPHPTGTSPPHPTGTRPPHPTGTKPPHPTGSKPPHPTGSRPPHPTGTRPPHPTGSRPPHPTGTRPPHPTGSSPPLSSQKPHPPHKPMAFWIKFELAAIPWKDDYKKKDSKLYKLLDERVEQGTKAAVHGLSPKGVQLDEFGKGKKGVVVVLIIELAPNPPHHKPEDGKKRIEEMLKKRFLKIFSREKIIFYSIWPKSDKEVEFKDKDRKDGKEEKTFQGGMRLTSEVFKEDYKDLKSVSSRRFITKFEGTLKKVLSKINPDMLKWMTKLNVDKLKKGSVVVSFTAAFKPDMPEKMGNMQEALQKEIKESGGKFGDMKADVTSVQITEISREDPGKVDKQQGDKRVHRHRGLTHEVKAAIVVMSLLLLGLCVGGGLWYFQTRKNAKKGNDVQSFENPIKFQEPVKVATYSVA